MDRGRNGGKARGKRLSERWIGLKSARGENEKRSGEGVWETGVREAWLHSVLTRFLLLKR